MIPEDAAALRAHFAAERMPEDVQALLAKAQKFVELRGFTQATNLVDELALALEAAYTNRDGAEAGFRAGWEAAQRTPVSPEVREALAEVLMSIYDHGTQPNALREADAILARFSVPSQPVYDEEKLIALLNSAQHAPPSTHSPVDGSCQECPWPLYTLSPEEIAAALVAALRGGELTREET